MAADVVAGDLHVVAAPDSKLIAVVSALEKVDVVGALDEQSSFRRPDFHYGITRLKEAHEKRRTAYQQSARCGDQQGGADRGPQPPLTRVAIDWQFTPAPGSHCVHQAPVTNISRVRAVEGITSVSFGSKHPFVVVIQSEVIASVPRFALWFRFTGTGSERVG